jgi:hypothetical protein
MVQVLDRTFQVAVFQTALVGLESFQSECHGFQCLPIRDGVVAPRLRPPVQLWIAGNVKDYLKK